MKPVLILGGSGQAGAGTAALLRRWYPALPLTIAGRNLARAQRVADELGDATAVTIDITRRDLGLPPAYAHSAVIATLWDQHLNGLYYAQQRGLPYLSISSGLVELAPEVIAGAQRPSASPILVASHFAAGAVVLAILELAKEFEQLESIRIGAILDEQDAGGPAGMADLDRLSIATSAGLVRRNSTFTWLAEEEVEVVGVDGVAVAAQTIPILDVPSLALATGAPDVRFDFAVGESAGRRRGETPSLEVRIDLAGVAPGGAPFSRTTYLIHPAGQQPITALGITLGAERLLGLRGEPVAPGIHTPESIIEPAYAFDRLLELGATFTAA